LSGGCGIDYYRARYYNPTTGRFLSEDPSGLRGGINLYAYAGGSPTNFTDPSGLKPHDPGCNTVSVLGCDGNGGGRRGRGGNGFLSPELIAQISITEALGGGPEDPIADAAVVGEVVAAVGAGGDAAAAASLAMEEGGGVTLFHGTDIDSAFDIAENGVQTDAKAFYMTPDTAIADVYATGNPAGGVPSMVSITLSDSLVGELEAAGNLQVIDGGIYQFTPGAWGTLNEVGFNLVPAP